MESRIFQAVASVIRKSLKKDEGRGKRNVIHPEKLDAALSHLINSYSIGGLNTKDATNLNFSYASLRWAYAYLFLMSHTRIVLDVLSGFWRSMRSAEVSSWQSSVSGRQLRVCCVGGGPGTDLLAVSLFVQRLIESGLNVSGIKGCVLDQWEAWKYTYLAVAEELDTAGTVLPQGNDVSYDYFQLYEDRSTPIAAMAEADLVTMVKFVSAASPGRDCCKERLTNLVQQMKEGALYFVLDNSGGECMEVATEAAMDAGFYEIVEPWSGEMGLDDRAYEAVKRSKLCRSLQARPQKSCNVAATLWKKSTYCRRSPSQKANSETRTDGVVSAEIEPLKLTLASHTSSKGDLACDPSSLQHCIQDFTEETISLRPQRRISLQK